MAEDSTDPPFDPIRWVDDHRDVLARQRSRSDTCLAIVRVEGHGDLTVSLRPCDLIAYMQTAVPLRADGPFNSGDAVAAAAFTASRRLLNARNIILSRKDFSQFTVAPASGPKSATPLAGVIVARGAHQCATTATAA